MLHVARPIGIACLSALLALCAAAQDPVTPPTASSPPAPPLAPVVDAKALAAADALLAKGKHDEAKKAFATLAAITPDEPRVLAGLGSSESALGLYDDAVGHLSRAYAEQRDAKLELQLAQALHGQAVGKLAAGDPEAADMSFIDARHYYESAGDALKSADAWWGAGQVAIAKADQDDAIRCFERALMLDAKHVPSLVAAGGVHFARYVAATPKDAKDSAAVAAADVEKKASEDCYRKILVIDPKNALGMNGLGWIAKQSGATDEAITWFQKSLVADPAQNDSFVNLCELIGDTREDKERLVKLLDPVVDGARKNNATVPGRRSLATAFYYRGKAKALARQFAPSKADFAEATRLEPGFGLDCGLQNAKSKIANGERDEAVKDLLALAKKDHALLVQCIQSDTKLVDLATSIYALGDAKYKGGDMDAARELFRLAAEGYGTHAGYWNNYALLARDTNHFEDAYAAYETALSLNPNDPALLNDTAVVLHYNLRRDLDRARVLYERAIEEGNRVLADTQSDSFAQESATTAVRDATNNLRRLDAGQNEEEPPASAGG